MQEKSVRTWFLLVFLVLAVLLGWLKYSLYQMAVENAVEDFRNNNEQRPESE